MIIDAFGAAVEADDGLRLNAEMLREARLRFRRSDSNTNSQRRQDPTCTAAVRRINKTAAAPPRYSSPQKRDLAPRRRRQRRRCHGDRSGISK